MAETLRVVVRPAASHPYYIARLQRGEETLCCCYVPTATKRAVEYLAAGTGWKIPAETPVDASACAGPAEVAQWAKIYRHRNGD